MKPSDASWKEIYNKLVERGELDGDKFQSFESWVKGQQYLVSGGKQKVTEYDNLLEGIAAREGGNST